MALKRDTNRIGEALANAAMPQQPRSLRAQIAELGGAKAAAVLAGRSASSVYRWLRGVNKPSAAAKSALNAASAAWRASQDYRRSKLAAGREKRFRTKGARLTLKGLGGPKIDSVSVTIKDRIIKNHPLTAESMSLILDAWLTQGDEAAIEALEDALAIDYLALHSPEVAEEGWRIDTITQIKFT